MFARPSARSFAWLVFAVIACAGAGADLVTKSVAFSSLGMPGSGRRVILVPDVLVFETNLNEGALFGMGQGLSWLFAGISFVALVVIVAMMTHRLVHEDRWLGVALISIAALLQVAGVSSATAVKFASRLSEADTAASGRD